MRDEVVGENRVLPHAPLFERLLAGPVVLARLGNICRKVCLVRV